MNTTRDVNDPSGGSPIGGWMSGVYYDHIMPLWSDSRVLVSDEIHRLWGAFMRNQSANDFYGAPLLWVEGRQWRLPNVDGTMHDPQAGPPSKHPKITPMEYERLSSRRFRKKDMKENFKQSECVICSEAFKSNQKIPKLSCGHDFHWKCLKRWATRERATCPICVSVLI